MNQPVKSEKEVLIAEFRRLKAEISAALKIQALRGNKDAEFVLEHL